MNINMLGGAHLLRYLGLDAGNFLSQLEGFQSQQQLGMLQGMRDGFQFASGFTAATQLANMLQSGMIPGAGLVRPPMLGGSPYGGSYAQPQVVDFGASAAPPFSMPGLMARQQGAMFERMLGMNPFARQQVEMMLGGTILPDGIADGRMQVMPFPPAMMAPGGVANPAMMGAMGFMNQIMQGAAMMGALGPTGMFQQMMMGALANVMNGGNAGTAGNQRMVDINEDIRRGAPVPGQGGQPGVPGQQGGPAFGGVGGSSGGIMGSNLSIEDKVALMLMKIMKDFDKQIEAQMKYVESLQNKSNGGGGGKGGGGKGGGGKGGGGKGGGGAGGEGDPSIDIETLKLKRLIEKRGQMFDTLRQIIDKYSETAKNQIQSIGR